jgi:hypothetical protein
VAHESLWSDDADKLAHRIELRLEQYRIHASSFLERSVERSHAEEHVKRLEAWLESLRRWKASSTTA